MKTINRKLFVISLCLFGIVFASCDTLDQEYHMGYDANDVFTSPEKIASAAIGMYDAMQNQNFLGGRALIYADVRSIDTNPSSYFGALSSMDGSMTSNNAYNQDGWQAAYRTVFEINLFIEKLEASSGIVSDEQKNQYINEARFLRGVVYFYALNLWGDQYTKDGTGLGIPYIDKSYDGGSAFGESAKVPRMTTTEVYGKIEDDLKAGTNLPNTRGSDGETLYMATANAAWAMLTRVYLYQGKYADVLTAAANISGFSLDPDLKGTTFALPPTSSKEIIFFIAHNESDNPNTNHALGQHYGAGRRGDINVSGNFIALLDQTNDIRFKDLIVKNEAGSYFTNKYPNGPYNWVPVIRYAEVILNKAEASAKQATGVDGTAIGLINEIRTRAGVDPVSTSGFANKDALIKFILEERRRELAFEGHGSFDLFRNGNGIPEGRGSVSAVAIPYPSNLFAMPIPQRDITKATEILIQNPGY